MKEFEANSNVIAGDIQRLQSEIINFETKEFLDIERYNQDSKVIVDKVREYNRSIITTQTDYNNLTTQINSINNKLSNYQNDITRLTNSNIDLEKQLKTLRVEYSHTNTKAVCDKC
jgi:chromosome segregation ATPase